MAVAAVARTRAAAKEDFAGVFAAHHGEALRLAYVLCGDAHRAEDAVAEAFTKMYRRWRRGRIEHPRAYLRRAVVNEVSSRFRRLALERREAQRRHGDDRGARSSDDALADVDLVYRGLRALPERQRTAIVLRFYADLSEADTADAMDVSVGTVKSSVSRGLQRLRAAIGEEVT